MNKVCCSITVLVLIVVFENYFADDSVEAMAAGINEQLIATGRDQYDAAKDPGRKPVETMEFFGVTAGMTVLDVITGADYKAEILSAAVGST